MSRHSLPARKEIVSFDAAALADETEELAELEDFAANRGLTSRYQKAIDALRERVAMHKRMKEMESKSVDDLTFKSLCLRLSQDEAENDTKERIELIRRDMELLKHLYKKEMTGAFKDAPSEYLVLRLAMVEGAHRATVHILGLLRDELHEVKRQRDEFRYQGVWERGITYREGNFVTDDGSLWACLKDTQDRPGASLDWQLCCKRGKDGRDGQ